MTITVQQASEFINKRQDLREIQAQASFNDLVFYAEVVDFNELARCNGISNIEEWLLCVGNKEKINETALMITSENEDTFTLSTFVSGGDGTTPTVVQTPLSKEAFLQLKNIGVKGYMYRRNRFDIPYTQDAWLVDIFKDYTGNDHPWVRITLALNSETTEFPKLPFRVNNAIYEADKENETEQLNKLSNLWKNEWCCIEKS